MTLARKRPVWTPQEEAAMSSYVCGGFTVREIARLLGRSTSSVETRKRVVRQRANVANTQPMPPRVDRDPCGFCGVRADIGCHHQRVAA